MASQQLCNRHLKPQSAQPRTTVSLPHQSANLLPRNPGSHSHRKLQPPGHANDVSVQDNYPGIADFFSGLQIIDISNPSNPVLKSTFALPQNQYAYGLTVSGNYAYILKDASGLQIVDISDPSNPISKSNLSTGVSPGNNAFDAVVAGNYLYIANNTAGLQIVDVSDPSNPVLKGALDTPGNPPAVAVAGNYAFLVDGSAGLKVIDVDTPTNPVLKKTFSISGSVVEVSIVGNYAYLANGSSGLFIVDIADPLNPVVKGSIVTPGNAKGVHVIGNRAYVAGDGAGLHIVDVSNPSNPTIAGSYDTTGNANRVTVVGNYAYVADGGSGLQIIDVSELGAGNQAPVIPQGQSFTIPEKSFQGTVVGTLQAVDTDPNTTFSNWHLVGGNTDHDNDGNPAFTINSATGQIAVNDKDDLIFETAFQFELLATVSDGTTTSQEQVVVVNLTDVNENPNSPPIVSPGQSFTIPENSPKDTVVGIPQATDPDANTIFSNWQLIGGNSDIDEDGNLPFAINSATGQITVNDQDDLNYEIRSKFELLATVSDDTATSQEQLVVVNLTNVDETEANRVPTNLRLNNAQVNENVPANTTIGNFNTIDPDAGNTFTYSLVSGEGSGDNGAFVIVENELKIKNSPDFETKPSYSIRVRSTDQGGLFTEETLTIAINDVSEPPPVTGIQVTQATDDGLGHNRGDTQLGNSAGKSTNRTGYH